MLDLIERVIDWWSGERWNRIKIAAWIMLPILFGTLWLTMGEFTPALMISLAAFALLWTIGHVHYKYKAFKEWSERRRLRKEARRTDSL